jgi:hypothetical protein
MNSNSNQSKFLNNTNLRLLWDVLLDELRIDANNKQIVSNIRSVFESNINPFTKSANLNANNIQLVNLNKQFLSQVVIAVNRLFPSLKQEQEFKRIQISSEEAHMVEPYKVEDIHSERLDTFEKQVNKKRMEFETFINQNKPAELDFSEKMDDGKIKEMEALIAETVARRKFDIEQIQHTPSVTNAIETPILEIKEQLISTPDLGIYGKLKLKSMTNANENASRKNVTWTDQIPIEQNSKLNNISLLVEEYSYPFKKENNENKDKIDILTDKVNILIDLMTKLTKKLGENNNNNL